MTDRNLYAVIPSGQRPRELATLIHDLIDYGDVRVVVVDTGYDRIKLRHPNLVVVKDRGKPINIQRWWNTGLRVVYLYQDQTAPGAEFTVAVLNDDLRVPQGFVERLDRELELTGAAAACPSPGLRTPSWKVDGLKNAPRMLGFAFALRGSLKLLADERFVWWYGDNDLDWRCRDLGGVVHVGGSWDGFAHLYPDSTTVGELAAQAGRDRETFVQKWGVPPW